jgi:hypothetical protein
MIVIPTSKHVTLHYGNTPVDLLANVLSLIGLAGLGALWWFGRKPTGDDDSEAAGAPPIAESKSETSGDGGTVTDDEADWLQELAGVGGPGT